MIALKISDTLRFPAGVTHIVQLTTGKVDPASGMMRARNELPCFFLIHERASERVPAQWQKRFYTRSTVSPETRTTSFSHTVRAMAKAL